MDILEQIAEFRAALQTGQTMDETTGWWDRCERIEAEIARDLKATNDEKKLVKSLKTAVSDGINVARNSSSDPDRRRISAILNALQGSVERRATGPDGWPLG